MNKLITSSTDEKTDEIDEILQDAENIILAVFSYVVEVGSLFICIR